VIHLDTNVAIALLNNRQPSVRSQFDITRAAGTELGMSIIVHHELMYGAANSERRSANEDKIAVFITAAQIALIEFTALDAHEAAAIRAHLKRLATPLGPYNVLITAQARRAGAMLVTANTCEFERVPGLVVTDWATTHTD
jgi:tRNA(fMet)-specific endonuclease VapC